MAVLAVIGCGRDRGDGPGRIVLGFSQLGAENAWRRANSASVQTAARDADIQLHFADAQQRQESQIAALRDFIARRVDVIAFAPVIENGWDSVLREAREAGIPVIVTDRAVEVGDPGLYVSLIGSDFVEEGRRAARWLVEHLSGGTGPVNIVELQGTVGSTPANDRKKGFAEIIAAEPRFHVIRSESGDFVRSGGREVMRRFLAVEGHRIQVLFSHNDDMTIGAIEAIEAAGRRPGTDNLVISIDGMREAVEAKGAGPINVIVECSPLLGPQLMAAVADLAAGRSIPRRLVTQESVFTQDRAAAELPNRVY
jgi:simple sugar transport system substrate-binding protein